jgi:site-specific DNA recombinase
VALDTLVPRIKVLEAERADVRAGLESAKAADEVIALHPAAIDRYATDVARLGELAGQPGDPATSAELVESLRRLVVEVVVHAPPNSSAFSIEVKGRLSELTSMFAARSVGGTLVAREGLEPPTPGL